MNKELSKLKQDVTADGIIDAAEVTRIREVIYRDGVIDKKEAEFLFELNDVCSGAKNHASWQDLFIEAITSFLLEDEISPDIIDSSEAKWLLSKVQADGKIDKVEAALLKNLLKKAKVMPDSLKEFITTIS